MREPIILLGTARSGTTLLGHILRHHPDVAYWGEPRPIWIHGNAYCDHDELLPEHLSPRIARFIDRRFAAFLAEAGRTRFAEKTPSNCLRVPFVHALYPDCRMVHIIRDGRAVVNSLVRERSKPPGIRRFRKRLREIPLLEWPAYLPLFFRTAWRTQVLKKPASFWGPKPLGWEQWVGLPAHVQAAKQWTATVGSAVRDGRRLPKQSYLELRYEELIEAPERVTRTICEFAGLAVHPAMVEYARANVDPNRASKGGRALGPEMQAEIVPHLEPLLFELGYGAKPQEPR